MSIFKELGRISCIVISILLVATSCIVPSSFNASAGLIHTSERPPNGLTNPFRSTGEGARGENGEKLPESSPPRPADALVGAEPRDTWEQIRLHMTMVPIRSEISSLRAFRGKLHRYHGNQQYFDTISRNARPWLFYVAERIAERGLPGELALLPAVESGYKTEAVSSRDAAGIWQIVPGTARELELPRSWWYDARADVVAATPAALDYLEDLHREFGGDWLLAVAAYNCGPGNVRRAIRRAGLEIETADYVEIERYLPRETRGHVARWLVLSEIVAMPRLHNVRLTPIPRHPYFAEIRVRSGIALASVAKNAGVPLAEFSRLNRGLRRGMSAPDGPHQVLVPVEHAERLRTELADAPAVARQGQPGQRTHRIRPGDTLGQIALAHRVTVETLMAANRLDSHIIRVGESLTIPSPRREPRSTTQSRSPRSTETIHVVKSGESLWVIARQHRTTIRSLRNWNDIAPGNKLLSPGQKLRIPRS